MAGPSGGAVLRTLKYSSRHNRAWQMALAVSLGLLLGLIPKANLLAAMLGLVILLLPVHTLLAFGTCCLASCCAAIAAEAQNHLGNLLLAHPKTQFLWESIDSTAWLPWMGLTNSAVLGGFSIGLAAGYPIFLAAYALLRSAELRCKRTNLVLETTRVLPTQSRAEPRVQSVISKKHSPSSVTQPAVKHELHWHMHSKSPARLDSQTQLATIGRVAEPLQIKQMTRTVSGKLSALESTSEDSILRFDNSEASTALQVAQRAADLARWADEALRDCLADNPMELLRASECSVLAATLGIDDADDYLTDNRSNGELTADRGESMPNRQSSDSDSAAPEQSAAIEQSLERLEASLALEPPMRSEKQHLSSPEDSLDCSIESSFPLVGNLHEGNSSNHRDENWLIETTIEVVRLAEQVVVNKFEQQRNQEQIENMPSIPNLLSLPHGGTGPTLAQIPLLNTAAQRAAQSSVIEDSKVSMPTTLVGPAVASKALELGAVGKAEHSQLSQPSASDSITARHDAAQKVAPNGNREEALRYLLRHLREIREKV